MSAGVKHFRAHCSEHSEKSAISLSLKMCRSSQGSLAIKFQVWNSSPDPCISSVTTSIVITTSNSSLKRSGPPNQLLGVLLHTIAMSGLSRVQNRTF